MSTTVGVGVGVGYDSGPGDALGAFAATVQSFAMPADEAAGTLNGTDESYVTTITPPATGTMTYAMAVKGTDAAGTLLSRVGVAAFAGRYASGGGATGISTTPAMIVSVDGVNFISGTNNRGQLFTALMDGNPHFVVLSGIPLLWDEIEAGNDVTVADQWVAGFLAPIAILSSAAADYAAALAAVEDRYDEWVLELGL